MSTVLLCHGDFPRRPASLEALRQATHLVCCDGAMAELERFGERIPDAIVGDLDSLSLPLRQRYAPLLHQEEEQETNDLSKALRFCRRHYPRDPVLILGATGKREDHTLGNLAILADQENTELWTDTGRFLPCRGDVAFPVQPGDQLSVIALSPETPVSLEGVRWPLAQSPLPRWWQGTLNEATSHTLRLRCPQDQPVLLYLPWREAAGKHPAEPPRDLPWKRVHFCGAGGVGVSGLAHLLLDAGVEVSGSDAADSPYLQALRQRGAKITLGAAPGAIDASCSLLVYSSAIPATHPEREKARALGVPQCRRGEFLARLAPRFRHVVAVAGSHGKTTTTAILAHLLKAAGKEPGYLVGGLPVGWSRNAAWGDGNYFVTEVDESDRSQELMLPQDTLILNVDDDHSWAVGGPEGLQDCFRRLARQSLRVHLWDFPGAAQLLECHDNGRILSLQEAEKALPSLPIPGRHNQLNAFLALTLLQLPPFSLSREELQRGLESFPGVERRLQLLAESPEGTRFLYEDYAHHPTELAACLEALRERHPDCPLTIVFQPHRPERLLRYGRRFAELLAAHAREVVVMAPFMAWETGAPEASPETLVQEIRRLAPQVRTSLHQGAPVSFLPTLETLWRTPDRSPGVILLAGAGDIGQLAKKAKEALSPTPNDRTA
ncbi:MAG: thiamine diphosphokinase [Oligosphaeraceae bacterium]